MNSMKNIRVEKITLNIGVGEPGDKLEKASKLLSYITGKKPVQTQTMKRIPGWNLRPNLKIATKLTIRGKNAHALLIRLLKAVNNKVDERKFDNYGNFSFGVPEYIDIEGVEYNAQLGMAGLDVAVTLERPGFRIKRRKILQTKIPTRNRITKQDAMDFMKKEFKIITGGEE